MAGNACIKCWFIFVNSLFLAIGAGLLGVGIWIFVDENSEDLTDLFLYLRVTKVFLYITMGLGGLMLLVGLIGSIGGCKDSTCLLKTFLAIVILLFIVQVAAVVILVVPVIQTLLLPYFKAGWDSSEVLRDIIQVSLECCGFSRYTEYNGNYPSTCDDLRDATTAAPAATTTPTPLFTNLGTTTPGMAINLGTTSAPSDIYTDSCFSKLQSGFQSISLYFYIGAGILLALELWQMISVCILNSGINKDRRVGDMEMYPTRPSGRPPPHYNRPRY